MRGTIVDAWYVDTEDGLGECCVCKETKYGTFISYAKPAEIDKDVANSWDGMRFAETKCDIKAYKAKAKIMRERAQGIQHACNVIVRSNAAKGIDIVENEVYQQLQKQCDVAWNNYKRAREQYEIMRDSYSGFCDQILKQRRKMRNRK